MRLLKLPLDTSSPLLTIVDTIWCGLLLILLVPVLLLIAVTIALASLLRSERPPSNR